MIGIYKITSPTGKINIGQSWDIGIREGFYRRVECKGQPKLYHSLKKYGWKAHQFEVLQELPIDVTQEVLDQFEIAFINQYKECSFEMLNIKEGGRGGKHSEETKKKMSSSSNHITHSKEVIDKFITKRKENYKKKKECGIFRKTSARLFSEKEIVEIFKLYNEDKLSRSKIAIICNTTQYRICNVLYNKNSYMDYRIKYNLIPVRLKKNGEIWGKIAYNKQFEKK